MLGDLASVQTYLSTAFAWSQGDLDLRMPGGESGHEVYGRYDAAIAEVVASGVATAAVVSHGAIIRSWTAARATNVTTRHAARNALANTGAVVLDGSPADGWTALSWEGHPVGGAELDVAGEDGPQGEPFIPVASPRGPR
jgi:probable phosphoglycerate mutase